MNQESIKASSTLLSPEKKQGGWKNILTIVFLVLFFPLGLILMWLLATWSRTTKIIITVVFVGLSIPIVIFIGIIFGAIDDVRDSARAASRLAGVRTLSFTLEKEFVMQGSLPLQGCATADAKTTTCIGPGRIADYFLELEDPMGNGICGAPGVIGPCDFGISREDGGPGARTDDYQICFYLETGAGGLEPGFHSFVTGGRMAPGCN